jgi:hypothetical protein
MVGKAAFSRGFGMGTRRLPGMGRHIFVSVVPGGPRMSDPAETDATGPYHPVPGADLMRRSPWPNDSPGARLAVKSLKPSKRLWQSITSSQKKFLNFLKAAETNTDLPVENSVLRGGDRNDFRALAGRHLPGARTAVRAIDSLTRRAGRLGRATDQADGLQTETRVHGRSGAAVQGC